MYSVIQLANLYNKSRNTIYRALTHADIQQYVSQTEQGLRLDTQGISVLNLILAGAPVHKQGTSTEHPKMNIDNIYLEKYIESLIKQNQELKQENAEWKTRYDTVLNMLNEQQMNTKILTAKTSKWIWWKKT